jgi:predicted phage tail protein
MHKIMSQRETMNSSKEIEDGENNTYMNYENTTVHHTNFVNVLKGESNLSARTEN